MIDVQGHRGCRGLLPENTIPAFLHAVDLGVTTLELDVVMSADGKVVVSHEPWLNREICLSPEGQKIAEGEEYNLFLMNFETITRCDCGSFGHPRFLHQQKLHTTKPLLSDVIEAVKHHCQSVGKPLPNFNVEIKSKAEHVGKYHPAITTFANSVVEVLRNLLPPEKYNIQSFDVATLRYVHNTFPSIKLAFLVEDVGFRTPAQIDSELKVLGFTPEIYSCWFEMLSGENVSYLHKMGVQVIPWTVNKRYDMQRMLNLGVDGIITDYPDVLLSLLTK